MPSFLTIAPSWWAPLDIALEDVSAGEDPVWPFFIALLGSLFLLYFILIEPMLTFILKEVRTLLEDVFQEEINKEPFFLKKCTSFKVLKKLADLIQVPGNLVDSLSDYFIFNVIYFIKEWFFIPLIKMISYPFLFFMSTVFLVAICCEHKIKKLGK